MIAYENTNMLLEEVKKIIEEGLEKRKVRFSMPPKEGEQGSQLEQVPPAVALGNLPHQNFGMYQLDERFLAAPYILVGMPNSEHDYYNQSWSLLIQTCCYSEVVYDQEDENRIPDNLAFMDNNILLQYVKEILLQSDLPLQMPVQMGDYGDKAYTYPLAYGYINCDIAIEKGITKKKFNYE